MPVNYTVCIAAKPGHAALSAWTDGSVEPGSLGIGEGVEEKMGQGDALSVFVCVCLAVNVFPGGPKLLLVS